MDKVLAVVKETRLFLTFMGTTGIVSAFKWDIVMGYVYTYNIHLGVITLVGIYVNHKLSNNRHSRTEKVQSGLQQQIKDIVLENTKDQIRAEIRQAYKDYKEIDEIDFETSIKYLRDLNKKRVELQINSYTDDMMNSLLSKIKIK